MNLLVFFLLLIVSAPADAQMMDPFAGAGTDWVSLDSYEKKAAEPEKTTDQNVQELMQATAPPPKESVVKVLPMEKAPPERALNFSVLPGSSVATGVTITSTVEENDPQIHEKKEWSDFNTADEESLRQEQAEQTLRAYKTGEGDPFAIRFSTLPSAKVQSTPAERISKPKLEREAQAAKAAAAAQKTEQTAGGKTEDKKKVIKETTEACEAFVDHRRRQLEAIESDRRTLAQLKAAMTELGLVNKLSFMTGQTSALVEPSNAGGPALMTKQP